MIQGNILNFYLPGKIAAGENALSSLSEMLHEVDSSARVFLISRETPREQELTVMIQETIRDDVFDTIVYDVPLVGAVTEERAREMAVLIRNSRANAVLAIGGEAEINLGKMAAFTAVNDIPYEEVSPDSSYRKIAFYAVPTEPAVHEAVIPRIWYFNEGNEMCNVNHDIFLANYVLIDHHLISGIPAHYLAADGLGILARLIEVALSEQQSEWTQLAYREGLTLLGRELVNVVLSNARSESYKQIMLSSFFLGLALNQTMRGPLFALCRTMGHITHKHHGIIGAVLLPGFMDLNMVKYHEQFMGIARAFREDVSDVTVIEAAIKSVEVVRRLINQFQIPVKLSDINVRKNALREVVRCCFSFQGIAQSSEPMDKSELLDLLSTSF